MYAIGIPKSATQVMEALEDRSPVFQHMKTIRDPNPNLLVFNSGRVFGAVLSTLEKTDAVAVLCESEPILATFSGMHVVPDIPGLLDVINNPKHTTCSRVDNELIETMIQDSQKTSFIGRYLSLIYAVNRERRDHAQNDLLLLFHGHLDLDVVEERAKKWGARRGKGKDQLGALFDNLKNGAGKRFLLAMRDVTSAEDPTEEVIIAAAKKHNIQPYDLRYTMAQIEKVKKLVRRG